MHAQCLLKVAFTLHPSKNREVALGQCPQKLQIACQLEGKKMTAGHHSTGALMYPAFQKVCAPNHDQ